MSLKSLKNYYSGLTAYNREQEADNLQFRLPLLRSLQIVTIAFFIYYTGHAIVVANLTAAGICLLVSLFVAGSFWLTRPDLKLRYKQSAYYVTVVSFLTLMTGLHVFVFGQSQNFTYIGWTPIMPMLALMLFGEKQGSIGLALYVAAMVAAFFLMGSEQDATINLGEMKGHTLLALTAAIIIAFIYENARRQTHSALLMERQQLLAAKEAYREVAASLRKEIDDREMVAKELRESRGLIRQVVDNSPNPIYSVNLEGCLLSWNPASEKTFGYGSEIIGKNCLSLLAEEQNRDEFKAMLESVFRGQAIEDIELLYASKQGVRIPTASRLYPVIDNQDNVIRCVVANTDMTTKMRAMRELEEAKEAAESASRAKSDFLAGMSHELRTPLNHIIGFNELLLGKHFGELNDVQEDYLSDAHNSSIRLLAMINNVLDLAKIEAGKLKLQFATVHLKRLLENCIFMLSDTAAGQGVELSLDLQDVPEEVTIDERKINQVVLQLLENAVKAMPDGGSVTVEVRPFTLLVSDQVTDSAPSIGGIRISCSDTGPGIDFDDLDRIFSVVEEKENNISPEYIGKGLGLALSKKIIELHGGQMWADSQGIGLGAKFSFWIPVT